MVPEIGEKIGPYEILGRLGSGGMGLVFSAWDSRLHRDVAIKLLRDEYLTPSMRSRFLGEARAASRLNHSNICTIFDIGEQDGCPYLVMELLKGETLRGRMQRGSLSSEEILCVAQDVADALSVAHGQGIIHRDIKPANIVLVEKSGGRFQTKVLDFGLAKIEMSEDLDPASGLTSTGMTVGTVSYMSPEQARGELLDRRSDLFALGVVLYEMATGRLPFTGATSALVFVHLLNDPPEPVRELNASIPRPLEQVILTCLQKERSLRYQSAEEMVEALRKLSLTGPPEEKQSWLAKLKGGKRQAETGSASNPDAHAAGQESVSPTPPDPPSRPLVPGDAMLRPVKRIRSSGNAQVVPAREVPLAAPEPFVAPAHFPIPENAPVNSVAPDDPSDPALPPPVSAIRPSALPEVEKIVLPPLTDEQWRSPAPRFQQLQSIEDHDIQDLEMESSVDPLGTKETDPGTRAWRLIFGTLIVLLAIVASVGVIVTRRTAPPVTTPSTVLLTPLSNRTGDHTLSGVSAGLELALAQSPHLALVGGPEFAATLAASGVPDDGEIDNATAQQAAKAAGATAYVTGKIQPDGSAFSIVLQVLNAATGKRMAQLTGTAGSRERIPGTIDSVAASLRSALGESKESIQGASVPLAQEATANLDALNAYASGEQLQATGSFIDAMFALEHAATLDPQFTQAHLRLAEIFAAQHAEVSAAAAADKAQGSGGATSERTRTLAQAAKALWSEQDYAKATALLQQVRTHYPFDIAALNMLALAQRLQGNSTASLEAARAALRLSPKDRTALAATELALLALDQTDEAVRVAADHPSSGTQSGAAILTTLLHSGATDSGNEAPSINPEDLDTEMAQASVLDANGQFRDGAAKWKDIATRSSAVPELRSSASYALGHGALDRALESDCTGSVSMLQNAAGMPTGPSAMFTMGAASAICGDLESTRKSIEALNAGYAQTFAAKGFYITDLNALVLWKSGLFADALVTLESAKEYDSISLTPYLRGLVYLSQRQPQMATVEYEAMLRHRGASLLVSPEAYPMAQIGAARAYAANGDSANAAAAYSRFLALWSHADPENILLTEARTGASISSAPLR